MTRLLTLFHRHLRNLRPSRFYPVIRRTGGTERADQVIEEIHRQIAPHNPGRAGRIAAWLVLGALILSAVGVILSLGAVIAKAHEAISGMPYPSRCCWSPQAAPAGRPGDCDEIDDKSVVAVQGGYQVTLAPGDHPMVKAPLSLIVPYDKVEHAEDGKFHICFRADMSMRCFFGGSNGS